MVPQASPRLDIPLALQRTLAALRQTLPAILLGGLLLVALPGLAIDLLKPLAGYAPDVEILLITLRAVLSMLFMAQLSWAVLARLSGRRLPPRALLKQGLAHAQPGLKVALLAGAAIVTGLILKLFAAQGTTQGFLLQSLLLTAALWAICTLMPAVPAAIMERLGPLAALRRAAYLTAGNRDRTLALGLIAGLATFPTLLWARSLSTPVVTALTDTAALALISTLAAVVYAGLTTQQDTGRPAA